MLTNNLVIYHDTDVPRWFFDQVQERYDFVRFSQRYRNPRDLDNFVSDVCANKIACFHVPFPEEDSWLERLHRVYPICQNVLVLCSELHESTVKQLKSLDLDQVTIFINGFISEEFCHAKIHQWMDFFNVTSYFYKNVKPDLLETRLLRNTATKLKLFDCLLGLPRPHRLFTLEYLKSNNLTDRGIVTYFDSLSSALKENSFILETEGLEFTGDRPMTWSIDPVIYYGYHMSLSQVIPLEIYNQTYYSVVAETNAFNDFNFYTEKTAKPLIAGRIFIAICGAGFLQNLRSLGFKTFHSIIDESYDLELDDQRRWTMALDQLKSLNSRDTVGIYEQARDILEHNRRLILETEWTYAMQAQMAKIVGSYQSID